MTIEPASRPLEPERARSNEMVFERSLAKGVRLTVDVYHERLEKLIDQQPDPATGLSRFTNVGRVKALGLEAELDLERASGWGGRISYSAMSSTDDVVREPMANSPHSDAKLNGSAPLGRWATASIEVLFTSAMTDYVQTRVPSYILPNVTLATRPLPGGWQLSASCYDVANQRWTSPMGPNDPEDQIQMDGRSWRFQVGYRLPVRGGRREP
jgi:outer membrane receptor protein involved in Fe transport